MDRIPTEQTQVRPLMLPNLRFFVAPQRRGRIYCTLYIADEVVQSKSCPYFWCTPLYQRTGVSKIPAATEASLILALQCWRVDGNTFSVWVMERGGC